VRVKNINDGIQLFEDSLFYKNYFGYHTAEKVSSYMSLELLMMNRPFYGKSEKLYLHYLDEDMKGVVKMSDLLILERTISNRNFIES